jgi:hypothetical protein
MSPLDKALLKPVFKSSRFRAAAPMQIVVVLIMNNNEISKRYLTRFTVGPIVLMLI